MPLPIAMASSSRPPMNMGLRLGPAPITKPGNLATAI